MAPKLKITSSNLTYSAPSLDVEERPIRPDRSELRCGGLLGCHLFVVARGSLPWSAERNRVDN